MKDLNDILAMAQNVQQELEKAQQGLDTIEVEGQSGGGLVKVKASAKGRILGDLGRPRFGMRNPWRDRPRLAHLR